MNRALFLPTAALALIAGMADAAPRRPRPIDPAARMPPLPPAIHDDTLVIGGDDIAARKLRTRMTASVNVNGTGPYRFVVDSGADTSVIGTRLAEALRLPAGSPIMLNGMTESTRVERVLVDELELGQSAFRDLELPALRDRDLGAAGMLGLDALVEQRLMLDFEKRVITVDDARRPAARFDGEIVVTARMSRGQLILTEARLNNRPIDAVIDTGSEITIGNLALRDQLFRRNADKFTTIEVTGVTGVTATMQLARVAELRLGPVILRDVPIAFAEVPPFEVFGLTQRPALLLGTDLMETFRKVSLDFRARKVRFQLRRCQSDNIVLSTSPDQFTRLAPANGAIEACRR